MIKKANVLLLVGLSVAILFSGCVQIPASNQTSETSAKVEDTKPNESTKPPEVEKPKVSGTITYYTSMPEANVTSLIEEFKKVQPDVTINLYRAGTGTVLAKLEAEMQAENVVADAISVAEPDASVILKERGQLLQYVPEGADKLAEEYKDKDGYFYSFGITNMVLIYNTQKIREIPKGYSDLLNPDYKNKISLGNPSSSGAMAHMVGTMLNNGYEWDYFENLKNNGAILVKGPSDAAQKVATGEAVIGITQDAAARAMKAEGSPVDYVFPEEGTVIKNTNIQIMKSTKNADAAIAWVGFLLSDETQQYIIDNQIMLPVVSGLKYPDSIEDISQIKAMKLDDELIAK